MIKEYEDLKKEIRKHNESYYKKNSPQISDFEYDELFSRLREMEKNHPEWISSDSPTQSPGDDSSSGFEKYKHGVPMLSIRNTYNEDEIRDFCSKTEKALSKCPIYQIEAKLDGAAVSITYENDKFLVGATRGNGVQGDDISENLKVISRVPLSAKFSKYGISRIEVRGEVIMDYSSLEEINQKREADGKPLYANTRNLTSGSLKLQDPEEVKERKLKFVIHSFGQMEFINSKESKTHSDLMDICSKVGFTTVPTETANNADEIVEIIKKFDIERFSLAYATDGMVIKIDSLEQRKQLGASSHSPRWVIAYKYPAEQKETTLLDIVYQVGRTGTITPKALFNSVHLAGTNVSQATLHNEDFIKEKDLRIGDTVVVEKGGEIIPKVIRVSKRGNGQKFKFISKCPECKEDLKRNAGESAWKCVNPNCPAQLTRRLQHFVSRQCLDIDGLGNEKIQQFIDFNVIKSFQDIFKIKMKDIEELDRMGKRMAEKILSSIEKAKNCDPRKLLHGLGIPLIGKSASPLLLEKVDKIQEIFSLTETDINDIDGLGKSIYDSLQQSKNAMIPILDELESLGVNVKVEKKRTGSLLEGINFCITGSFSNKERKEWEDHIRSNGGKVSGSVSKNTDYLFAGEGTEGKSKWLKAETLGTKIITEEEFEKLFLN